MYLLYSKSGQVPLFILKGAKMDLNYIQPLLSSKLYSLGYELYSLKYVMDKGNMTLQVVVDRVEPIDMSAIVDLTNIISTYMDEIVTEESPYTLDISSLGAEKPLKVENLSSYVSNYVEVRLINPILGENIYLGTIKEVKEDEIILEYRLKSKLKEINIAKSNISKIRLAIKF